jgi:LysR family transcriptional regulator, hydrogen peroxide-inducible genes activator
MNIQQFEYVLALAESRHFETAADRCHITQSTLSTMILKLEEELGILIFDRKKKPLEITPEGSQLIAQLQIITKEINNLTEIVKEIKGEIKGEISISVIPTIAPYLIPQFITHFAQKFPQLKIQVKEEQTAEIIKNLKQRTLDIGIVSIPINDKELIEHHLYNEPFVYFDMLLNTTSESLNQLSSSEQLQLIPKISAKELDLSRLCLLEEGHCMRAQVLELCDFHEKSWNKNYNFKYNAGSIDSLLRFVKKNQASTLLPYLAASGLNTEDLSKLAGFEEPIPYRSVGLLTHRYFVKHGILEKLKQEIHAALENQIPDFWANNKPLMPV